MSVFSWIHCFSLLAITCLLCISLISALLPDLGAPWGQGCCLDPTSISAGLDHSRCSINTISDFCKVIIHSNKPRSREQHSGLVSPSPAHGNFQKQPSWSRLWLALLGHHQKPSLASWLKSPPADCPPWGLTSSICLSLLVTQTGWI